MFGSRGSRVSWGEISICWLLLLAEVIDAKVLARPRKSGPGVELWFEGETDRPPPASCGRLVGMVQSSFSEESVRNMMGDVDLSRSTPEPRTEECCPFSETVGDSSCVGISSGAGIGLPLAAATS